TGRYILAGEIVVGTAVAAGVCIAGTAGGCGAAAPAIYGAAIGATSGGALGGYSAARNGGDLSSGILFGSAVGATTRARTGYAGGASAPGQAPLFETLGSAPGDFVIQAGAHVLKEIAIGTALSAASGAIASYAGGRGQLDSILASAGQNALSELMDERG